MPLISFDKVIKILEVILRILGAALAAFTGQSQPEDPEIGS